MDPAKLIEAKLQGAGIDRILHAVRTDREVVSDLPDDQLDFFESMINEVKAAVLEMERALKSDDLYKLRESAQSVKDIFLMIEDACER